MGVEQMKYRKLAVWLAGGLLLFTSCTATANSRLIKPYESPQGIYEDKDITIQMDVDSNFHIQLSLTNKTNNNMSIGLDHASVSYVALSPDTSSSLYEIGKRKHTSIPPNGHIELSLATSKYEGLEFPMGPGFGVQLSLPIKILGNVKDFNFLVEQVKRPAESINQKEQALHNESLITSNDLVKIDSSKAISKDSNIKALDPEIKNTLSPATIMENLPIMKVKSQPNAQTVEVAFKKYHLHYQEDAPDYETGWMTGMHLSYKNQNESTKQYWKISYDTTNHNDQYIGGLQDQAGNYLGDFRTITKNKITNREVVFATPVTDAKSAYTYIGIGYHNWDRDILGSGGVAGLSEKFSWKYIPIGYRNEYKIDNKWVGAVDIALRFMFDGKMKVPNPSTIDPFQVNLGSKVGFKLELPYTYHMNSNWTMVIKPWYEYWEIGQSNYVPQTINGVVQGNYVVYEPGSKNNQIGIDAGVSYKF